MVLSVPRLLAALHSYIPASSNVQSMIVKVELSSLTLICTLLEFFRISPWKYHVTSGLGYPAKPASNLALWPSFSLTSLISLMNFGACSVSGKIMKLNYIKHLENFQYVPASFFFSSFILTSQSGSLYSSLLRKSPNFSTKWLVTLLIYHYGTPSWVK